MISMTIKCTRQARCPACGADLISTVTTTVDGFAFCQPCATHGPGRSLNMARLASVHPIGSADFQTDRGIHFWTPRFLPLRTALIPHAIAVYGFNKDTKPDPYPRLAE